MQNPTSESIFDFDLSDFETVPQGQYIAIFKDVQKTNHDQWGEGVMFCFEIASGEHKGQMATRIGKPHATKGNATGKMIMGITGTQNIGRVDLRPFVGKPYNIVMEPTQAGKTRVANVWAYQRAQTMPVNPGPVPMPQAPMSTPTGFDTADIDQIPF